MAPGSRGTAHAGAPAGLMEALRGRTRVRPDRMIEERRMHKLRAVEREGLKQDIPDFLPGDTVKVLVRVSEGDKERLQAFEGVCIGRRGGGISETFTVRKISAGGGGGGLPAPGPAPNPPPPAVPPTLERERALWARGLQHVAGLDEVGRGPLAGPVVAAAVVLIPGTRAIRGLRASKQLTARQRERRGRLVRERAGAWGVGAASVREIDR